MNSEGGMRNAETLRTKGEGRRDDGRGTTPVKQVQKRFNPDEIRATEISSLLNKCKKGLTGQVGQAGQAKTQRV